MTDDVDTRTAETAHREPQSFLNYGADVRPDVAARAAAGTPIGADFMGNPLYPVTATYDPETGRTRVGLTMFPPVRPDA